MPVVSMKDILDRAFKERYGVAAFNIVGALTMIVPRRSTAARAAPAARNAASPNRSVPINGSCSRRSSPNAIRVRSR